MLEPQRIPAVCHHSLGLCSWDGYEREAEGRLKVLPPSPAWSALDPDIQSDGSLLTLALLQSFQCFSRLGPGPQL